MTETKPKSLIRNTTYDKLKFFALVVLPALGALYFGLAQIWDLPNAEKIIGTLVVIETFLGALLQLSSQKYYKSGANFDGEINFIEQEDGDEKVRFEMNSDPVEVIHDDPGKHSFEYKVNRLRGGADVG